MPEPLLSLGGRIIWVTRPRDQADSLCAMIEAAGGTAVRLPVTEIRPLTPAPDPEDSGRLLAAGDTLVFTSRNAVDYTVTILPDLCERLEGKQVIALGEATRAALVTHGVSNAVYAEHGIGSDALLETEWLQPPRLQGRRVIIIRGAGGGRETIIEHLRSHGVAVDCLEVYRRTCPQVDTPGLQRMWRDTPPGVLVITSVEGLRNLINMMKGTVQGPLFETPLAVISERIRRTAVELGFRGRIGTADQASDAGLLRAIEKAIGV